MSYDELYNLQTPLRHPACSSCRFKFIQDEFEFRLRDRSLRTASIDSARRIIPSMISPNQSSMRAMGSLRSFVRSRARELHQRMDPSLDAQQHRPTMLLFTPWPRFARSCAHTHASSHASHSKEKLLSTCLHHLCLPPMATTQQPQKPWRKAFCPLHTALSDDCHREQLILPSNLQNLTSTITAP